VGETLDNGHHPVMGFGSRDGALSTFCPKDGKQPAEGVVTGPCRADDNGLVPEGTDGRPEHRVQSNDLGL